MDIHGGDDLEVVDEDDGSHTGLADVAHDLGAEEVERGLVVALTEPEVLGVGAVALFCFGKVRDLGGRIVGVALAIEHPAHRLGEGFFRGGVSEEGLTADGACHQLKGGHLEGENEDIPPLLRELVRELHTKGGLAEGRNGAENIEAVVEAAVERAVERGKARGERGSRRLRGNVGVERVHLTARGERIVSGGQVRETVGKAAAEEIGGFARVGAEQLVEILALGQRRAAVEPREFIGEGRGPLVACAVIVRQEQNGGVGREGAEDRGNFGAVAAAVHRAGTEAEFFCAERVEHALDEENGLVSAQKAALKQRGRHALFVEVFFFGGGAADDVSVVTGQDDAGECAVIAEGEARGGRFADAAGGEVGGLPALFRAGGEVGGGLLGGHGEVSPFGVGCGSVLPSPVGGAARRFRCGAGNGHIAVAVEAARLGQRFERRGIGTVDGEEVKEVIVRPAGKAVDLMAAGVVGHRGVAVKVVRVQAAEAPSRVDAPGAEVVEEVGAERVEGVGHGDVSLSVMFS